MCALVKFGRRWLGTWWFWAFVLLVVPNCAFQTGGLCPDGGCQEQPAPCDGMKPCPETPQFEPGDPAKDTIVCDLPAPLQEGDLGCATAQEVASGDGFSLTEAATRLASGESKSFAFDWSPAAVAACGGLPRKITYLAGTFPDGANVCLNCDQKMGAGKKYANPTEVCAAKCTDLINLGGGPFPQSGTVADYCQQNAKTAVNYDKNVCYPDTCTSGGTFVPGFFDPRRAPEKLKWVDHIGTDDNGGTNTLKRVTATTFAFDAGAASAQTILKGDAWVEFSAGENGVTHLLSLRNSCADAFTCPDMDPGAANIGFGILLNNDNNVFVVENGPTVLGPYGAPYTAGERFRVRAVDNHDGKATISFSRIVGNCQPGTVCNENVFYTSTTAPQYPLRVDSTFWEQNATLVDVKIMRILEQ